MRCSAVSARAQGSGYDDNFGLRADSPAIDAGNGYYATLTDYYGVSRHDDPATTDSGIGYDRFVETSPGASVIPTGATALTGNYNPTYTLPFAFSFYGKSYTSVIVSNTGYLQFDANTGGPQQHADAQRIHEPRAHRALLGQYQQQHRSLFLRAPPPSRSSGRARSIRAAPRPPSP